MAREVYDRRAKPKSSQLKDIFLRHGINLTRYSNHQARKLLDILDTANVQIRGIVYKTKGVETKEHYRMVASEIKRITKDLTEQLDKQLELDFKDLAEEETRFVENAMKKVGVTADFDLPAPAKIWSAASFGSYTNAVSRMYPNKQQGVTFEQYINKFGNDVFNTWDNQVRAGYMFGLTAKQIARNVLGSMNTENMEVGQMQKLRKSLEMNTKTMVSHLAETARTETYRKNSSLFSGYRYVGTLDSRTCLVCGELDGKVFEGSEPPEEPHLPQHYNCRCLWLPEIKGMEGFDDDDTRASVDGPVSANMSYEEWLKTQDEATQKDILGATRFELYKQGMPVTSFVADGSKLTLDQLYEREGIKADVNNADNINKENINNIYTMTATSNIDIRQQLEKGIPQTEHDVIILGKAALDEAHRENKDVLDVLKKYRDFGTTETHSWKKAPKVTKSDFDTLMKRFKEATEYLPTDWLRVSTADLNKNPMMTLMSSARGSYAHNMWIQFDNEKSTPLHELAHRMEILIPGIVEREREFYNRRTAGNELKSLNELTGSTRYGGTERGREGFPHPYMGKDLGGNNFELFTAGLERIFYKRYNDKIDEEFDAFIVGLLLGI